jgi:hypothetical protein
MPGNAHPPHSHQLLSSRSVHAVARSRSSHATKVSRREGTTNRYGTCIHVCRAYATGIHELSEILSPDRVPIRTAPARHRGLRKRHRRRAGKPALAINCYSSYINRWMSYHASINDDASKNKIAEARNKGHLSLLAFERHVSSRLFDQQHESAATTYRAKMLHWLEQRNLKNEKTLAQRRTPARQAYQYEYHQRPYVREKKKAAQKISNALPGMKEARNASRQKYQKRPGMKVREKLSTKRYFKKELAEETAAAVEPLPSIHSLGPQRDGKERLLHLIGAHLPTILSFRTQHLITCHGIPVLHIQSISLSPQSARTSASFVDK